MIKIIKDDPLSYRYYINFIKRFKPEISHLSSSFSYLPIFNYINQSKNKEYVEEIIFKNNLYIGKPHGFYSLPFIFSNYKNAIKYFNDFCTYSKNNGVLKQSHTNYFERDSSVVFELLNNIRYIAETLGSTLSVAQGEALINNNQKYVIMGDAEIEMGEFYENLLLQKKYNFNITLLIDFNGYSKQNQTIIDIYELKKLLEIYNQSAVIFDTRNFREYFIKEIK